MTANKSSPSKPASPKASAAALDTSVTSVEGEGAEAIPEDFEVEEGDGTVQVLSCCLVCFMCEYL